MFCKVCSSVQKVKLRRKKSKINLEKLSFIPITYSRGRPLITLAISKEFGVLLLLGDNW